MNNLKDIRPSFLMHSGSFSERGDSVTLLSLGSALRDYYSTEVYFAVPKNSEFISWTRIAEAELLGFEFIFYSDKQELLRLVEEKSITHTYVFSGGRRTDLPYFDKNDPESFRIGQTKHITHVVFKNYDPHGEIYGYVSEWLQKASLFRFLIRRLSRRTKTKIMAIPHFVDWSEISHVPNSNLREALGIGPTEKVIGRLGGYREFSDPAAKRAIIKLLKKNPGYRVICVNTEPFFYHPRLIYIEKMTRAEVLDFYNACDVLVNGRLMGESFGYSIVEPLSLGKPVIAPHWIRNPLMDKNHIQILSQAKLLYYSSSHFQRLINKLVNQEPAAKKWMRLAHKFTAHESLKELFAELDL